MSFLKNIDPRRLVKGKGNPFDKVKDTVKREVLDEIRREAVKPLEDKIKKLERQIVNDVKKPLEKEIKELKGGIVHTAEDVFRSILKALASEALRKYIEWIEIFEPSKATLYLGPVSFEFNAEKQLQFLKSLRRNPPASHDALSRVLEVLLPVEVTLSLSGHIALGIGSNELGAGGSLTVPTKRLVSKIKTISLF